MGWIACIGLPIALALAFLGGRLSRCAPPDAVSLDENLALKVDRVLCDAAMLYEAQGDRITAAYARRLGDKILREAGL